MSCNYKVRTRSMARNGKDSAQTDIDIKDGILPSVGIALAVARTLSPSPNPALALALAPDLDYPYLTVSLHQDIK